jgi:hypothetical protein
MAEAVDNLYPQQLLSLAARSSIAIIARADAGTLFSHHVHITGFCLTLGG